MLVLKGWKGDALEGTVYILVQYCGSEIGSAVMVIDVREDDGDDDDDV